MTTPKNPKRTKESEKRRKKKSKRTLFQVRRKGKRQYDLLPSSQTLGRKNRQNIPLSDKDRKKDVLWGKEVLRSGQNEVTACNPLRPCSLCTTGEIGEEESCPGPKKAGHRGKKTIK